MVGPPDSLHVRMMRSALGDSLLYDELARDPGAIRQALFVVVLVSILHGVAAALGTLYSDGNLSALNVFISSSVFTGLGWTLSALFSYMIVSVIAGTSAAGFLGGTFLQFLRSVGFTASPALLMMLVLVPVIGDAAAIAATIWIATAMMIATRESLSCSMPLAAVAVIVGTIIGRAITLLTLVIVFAPAA